MRGVLALAVALVFASPVAAETAAGSPGHDLVGVWKLDLERSDSVEPLMKRMDIPWVVRRMSASMEPTMTITRAAAGLRVVNRNPVRDSDRTIVVDGSPRSSEDGLGRPVSERAEWQDDGSLKVWRTLTLDDGPVEVEAVWSRRGDDLVLTTTLPDDGTVIERVFGPEPAE